MRYNVGGKKRLLSVFFLLLAGFAVALAADDTTWPKVVKNDKGELTIYQPQPESLDGTMATVTDSAVRRLTLNSRESSASGDQSSWACLRL